MKNELGRKITSLTIMAIMVAGGLTFAIPEVMPEAAAQQSNEMLYVSAENSLFGNTFAGAQIVEIIVRDHARDETDEVQGEPTVEVNNEVLRMVQGADGYWYAYIGSTNSVGDAHDSDSVDHNVDFGTALTKGAGPDLCHATTCRDTLELHLAVSSSATVYVDDNTLNDQYNGRIGAPSLSPIDQNGTDLGSTATTGGQLNVTTTHWPFVQTWEFSNDSDVEIVFESAGVTESVMLNYEGDGDGLEDYAYIELDRNEAPAGAMLHMTIYDQQLNLDPTYEDTVVFMTNASQGVSFNTSAPYRAMDSTHFGDNGQLKITLDASGIGQVLQIADNDDCVRGGVATATTLGLSERNGAASTASSLVCFTETGSNTGIFTNGDDADVAAMNITTTAKRGATATIDYNDSEQSLLVTTTGATINIHEEDAGDAWTSGEIVGITLVDPDRNLNTQSDEDLVGLTSVQIPAIIVGSPLGTVNGAANANLTADVDESSNMVTWKAKVVTAGTDRSGGADWTFESGLTAANINAMNSTNDVIRYVVLDMTNACSAGSVNVAGLTSQAVKGVLSYATTEVDNDNAGEADLQCQILNSAGTATGNGGSQVAVDDTFIGFYDFIAFGDGETHGIYRVEVEETDDNTGVFTGEVDFIMLNQNTVDVAQTSNMVVQSDAVTMIMASDETGVDAPRIKYNDTDGDGVWTGVADQLDVPTHSAVVTFDSENYKVADTVTITVNDMDLNTDGDLIDVYMTQSDDLVDDSDESNSPHKHILDVYFGDILYDNTCANQDGLFETGFNLVETGAATGIFTGTFQIPSDVCQDTDGDGTVEANESASTTGLDMFTNYWDFKDAGGNQVETGAAAAIAANSGSVSLDRAVYPVPFTWGQFTDHNDAAISGNDGNVTITVLVTDADYDLSPVGEDTIAAGAVVITAVRGSTTATIEDSFSLKETEASSGVFEYEFTINGTSVAALGATALRQGDVITATYTDPTDASGNAYVNTDSSTLDLRTGSLLSDKSVYVIGSDAIITIVDADLNLDSGSIESYTLNLV